MLRSPLPPFAFRVPALPAWIGLDPRVPTSARSHCVASVADAVGVVVAVFVGAVTVGVVVVGADVIAVAFVSFVSVVFSVFCVVVCVDVVVVAVAAVLPVVVCYC